MSTNFNAAEYKERLKKSTSINDCEIIPVKLKEDDDYVLLSYAHADYKQVYAAIADLYENGVAFWYDNGHGEGLGIPPGYTWPEFVQEKINDNHCRGVIFFMSDSLFVSASIQREIELVLDRKANSTTENSFRYFAVNLTDDKPHQIVQRAIAKKDFSGFSDEMEAMIKWQSTLGNAFSNKQIYLSFSANDHRERLIKSIDLCFNVKAKFKLCRSDDKPLQVIDNSQAVNKKLDDAGIVVKEEHYSNGASYIGGFKGNKKHGKGVYKYANGSVYDGEYKDGKRHGKGTHTYFSGDVYDGEWQKGKKHGKGIYKYSDGSVYDGEWQNGQMHGRGVYKWPDGDVYEGEFKLGKKHGKGIYKYTDGSLYDGEWQNSEEHGIGVFKWPDGDIYEGEWQNGQMHGKGVCKYSDGSVYEGEWQNGEAHGLGVYKYADGSVYDGEWRNDKRHGKGICKYSDGTVYDGEWRNDKEHGVGISKWPNGNIHEGEYRDGKMHGKCVYKYSDGTVYNGSIYSDMDGAPKALGHGVYTFPDGRVRSGTFIDTGFNV